MSVKEAAARLGVSERRVQALIEAGRLPARRVGRMWLVPVADLSRVKYRSRPLSPRAAHAVVRSVSGKPSLLAGSEAARHHSRMAALVADADPAALLRSWLAAVAPPVRRLAVAPADLSDLRADRRLVPGGISDPRSGLAVVDEFEAWIAAEDVDAVQREFLMVDSAEPNVVLRIANDPVDSPLDLGWLLSDLASRGGPREAAAVGRLLQDVKPQLEAERPSPRARRSAPSADVDVARAQARADREAARAKKAEAAARQALARAKAARAAARKAERAAAEAAGRRKTLEVGVG